MQRASLRVNWGRRAWQSQLEKVAGAIDDYRRMSDMKCRVPAVFDRDCRIVTSTTGGAQA